MIKTVFKINKMDCPSEEQLIRLSLSKFNNIMDLEFSIDDRILTVYHIDDYYPIYDQLKTLNLETTLIASESIEGTSEVYEHNNTQSRLLWQVLIINFLFFVIELAFGFISNSLGLVADSLDMLADAFVYGLALIAVKRSDVFKKNIAKVAGYFQMVLALFGFLEVLRRFIGVEKVPSYEIMIVISIFAMIANIISLMILNRNKSKESHMKASMIFTSNDIIANIGVIIAGVLVYATGSKYPDLIVGAIVFIVVVEGATRILKLSK
ncbi:MAG: cation transporter [Calditerrivibrio sp.]|nr:cation transporter [Calditerrivibrio sp.]